MSETKPETFWVACAKPDGKVCLWDQHPDHPGGEVFVAGDTAAEAAMSPGVAQALGQGRIVKVSAPPKSERTVAADAKAAEQPAAPSSETDPGESGGAPVGDAEADARELSVNLGDAVAGQLAEAGYASPAGLMQANDEQLLAVPGVGKATLEKIRELYPQIITD